MAISATTQAVTAQVKDGKITSGVTETTKDGSTKKTEASSSLDKNAFLGLLVAQMKYQDPLEPTSNTEYISQFATFSELEEMQNLSTSMDTQRASSLVGQYVTVKTKSEATGNETLVGGKVDYVAIEGNKAYLNINGQNYSIDDLDSVVDEEYLNAYTLATDFNNSLSSLPPIAELTVGYKEVIENLRTVYEDMTDYQKSFLTEGQVSMYQEYVKKMDELTKTEE